MAALPKKIGNAITRLMSADEARVCINEIKSGIDNVGRRLLELKEREGWKALGYASWRECAQAEFGFGQSYVYRLLSAAEVERNISPMGESLTLPERQAREVAALEPDLQKAVYQIAVETAPTNDEGTPMLTAGHIKSVATVVKEIVKSGGLDDGSGEVKPLGVLVDAAVTEETYERMMRQKERVKEYLDERSKIIEKMPHVSHNSGENEWYTPKEFIEAACAVMGGIDLDPASCKKANVIVGAANYYDRYANGLDKDWTGRVWMNPPYASDLIGKFTTKLTQHYLRDEVQEALVLVNNATETSWFQDMAQHANAICLLRGRVRFWGPDGLVGAPLQGQAVLYFGCNRDGFNKSFQEFGLVVWRTM